MGYIIPGAYILKIFDAKFFDNKFLINWKKRPDELMDLECAKQTFVDQKMKNPNHIFTLEVFEEERSHELADLSTYLKKIYFDEEWIKLDVNTGKCSLSFWISNEGTPECRTHYNYIQSEDFVLFDKFDFQSSQSWQTGLGHTYNAFKLVKNNSMSNLRRIISGKFRIEIKTHVIAKYCTPEILSLFINLPINQTTSKFDSDEIDQWAESEPYRGLPVDEINDDRDLTNFELETRGYIYKNTDWRDEFVILSWWTENEVSLIYDNLHRLYPRKTTCVEQCEHWKILVEKISLLRALETSNKFVFIHSLFLAGPYSKMIVFDSRNEFLENIGVELTTPDIITDKVVLEEIARGGKTVNVRLMAVKTLQGEKLIVDILKTIYPITLYNFYDHNVDEYIRFLVEMINNEHLLFELAIGDYDYSVQYYTASKITSEKLLRKIAIEGKSSAAHPIAIDKLEDEETRADFIISSECNLSYSIKKISSQSVLFRIFNETDNPENKKACIDKIIHPKYLIQLLPKVDEKNKELINKKLSIFDLRKKYSTIADQVLYEDEAKNMKLIEKIVGFKFRTFKFGIPGTYEGVRSVLNFQAHNFRVVSLEIQNLSLPTIPQEIFSFENLHSLNLSSNKIHEIPKNFGMLQKLKILNLSQNLITSIDNLTRKSMVISELTLHLNKLSEIPNDIGNLSRLSILDLNHNQLSHLPSTMRKLPIEKLWIDNNRLTEIGDYVKEMSKLRILSAKNNKIQIFPNFGSLNSRLKNLHLCNNELELIPSTITNLDALNSLNLCNNNIKKLPENIYNCKNLEYLSVPNNLLTDLPEKFNSFVHLKNFENKSNPLHPSLQFSSFDYWEPPNTFDGKKMTKEENLINHNHTPIYPISKYLKKFFDRVEYYRDRLSKKRWVSNDELSYYSKLDGADRLISVEHYCDDGCSTLFDAITNQEDLFYFLKKHDSTIYDIIDVDHENFDLLVKAEYIIELLKLDKIPRWQVFQLSLSQELLKRLLLVDFDDYSDIGDVGWLLWVYKRIENLDESYKLEFIWMLTDNFDGEYFAKESEEGKFIIEIIKSIEEIPILFKLPELVYWHHLIDAVFDRIRELDNIDPNDYFQDRLLSKSKVPFEWLYYVSNKELFINTMISNIHLEHFGENNLGDITHNIKKFRKNSWLKDEDLMKIAIAAEYPIIAYSVLNTLESNDEQKIIVSKRKDLNVIKYLTLKHTTIPLVSEGLVNPSLIVDEYNNNNLNNIDLLLEGFIKSQVIKIPKYWFVNDKRIISAKDLLILFLKYKIITTNIDQQNVATTVAIYSKLIEIMKLTDSDLIESVNSYSWYSAISSSENVIEAFLEIFSSKKDLKNLLSAFEYKDISGKIKVRINECEENE